MRVGIRKDHILPAVVLPGYEKPIQSQIVTNPTDSLLFKPFQTFASEISQQDRSRLKIAGRKAISESVVPGYEVFLDFMRDEYVLAARQTVAASALPQGRKFYEHRVRRFSTLDVTPLHVHELGLSEVKRIRNQMDSVIQQVDFDGNFSDFLKFLRTDGRFYAASAEELLKEVSYVLKRMDGELPKLFRRLPRIPYGIRQIPDYIAPNTTTAYYMQPSGDGTQAGFYYVNTHDLRSRPLYELEALSLHEAVPGHHLQIALQQELEDLPTFRRFEGFTAFVEGWALYAEKLGLEVGFYENSYSNFGRLSYEMWRACRLVVDTGLHYFGWTRQQAIDFMVRNTALTRHNIGTEVDRYISWPGQALAYKMGELHIHSLRHTAEERLGTHFDVRDFHNAVLQNGAIPLPVLTKQVEQYIDKTLDCRHEETERRIRPNTKILPLTTPPPHSHGDIPIVSDN